jgi:hypothetical protein
MEGGSLTIQDLIDRPSESLSVEVKRWIDPAEPEGAAKIIRATLALRNHGGGYLVVGFDDATLEPDTDNIPEDARATFHIDTIQGLVTKYASEAFEVSVEFGERGGRLHPVIVVPTGIKTPVAAKADLFHGRTKLIACDDIYVRSLNSNNTPSTTKATWKDWPKVVEVCFDNREADIGRFLRRHFVGVTPKTLAALAAAASGTTSPPRSYEDDLLEYLREGEARFQTVLAERKISLPSFGTWEVALIILGDVPPYAPDQQFLNLLDASNPGYTGWPVWFDSRQFSDLSARPYVFDGVWETLVVSLSSGWSNHVDFLRIDPRGRFYLLRALEDDISRTPKAPKSGEELDFGLPVIRTAEAIAVGIAFAKAMGCDRNSCFLAFAFCWRGLRGRTLTSWANLERYISPGRKAYQDEVTVFVNVPLDVSLTALGELVNQAVQPLYRVFDGMTLSKEIIDDLTTRLIERRL